MNINSRFSRLPAYLLALFLSVSTVLTGCGAVSYSSVQTASPSAADTSGGELRYGDLVIPAYSGEPYTVLSDNVPTFTPSEETTTTFEAYHALDRLGRCGTAFACLGKELMPTEKRGDISQVTPSGWHSIRYDFVDGGSLYNRCHLIGYQLSGENANEQNLITGTRYLNVEGMLPFENMVADYVQETGNHVLYRVTPIFQGTELVARGVQMEAESVEDQGEGICFNVYVYNDQPGITIDYATGASSLEGDALPEDSTQKEPEDTLYILNTSSGKFHLPSCSGAASMKEENRQAFSGSREELIAQGYSPCGQCKP